jgi:hypothetical protein
MSRELNRLPTIDSSRARRAGIITGLDKLDYSDEEMMSTLKAGLGYRVTAIWRYVEYLNEYLLPITPFESKDVLDLFKREGVKVVPLDRMNRRELVVDGLAIDITTVTEVSLAEPEPEPEHQKLGHSHVMLEDGTFEALADNDFSEYQKVGTVK